MRRCDWPEVGRDVDIHDGDGPAPETGADGPAQGAPGTDLPDHRPDRRRAPGRLPGPARGRQRRRRLQQYRRGRRPPGGVSSSPIRPDVLTETTADFAWALLMATARRVVEGDRYVRQGRFKQWEYMRLLGGDVHGKTLGHHRLRPHRPRDGAARARLRHARALSGCDARRRRDRARPQRDARRPRHAPPRVGFRLGPHAALARDAAISSAPTRSRR